MTSFLVHALFILVAFLVPPDPWGISLDMLAEGNRFVRYAILEPPSTFRGGEVPPLIQAPRLSETIRGTPVRRREVQSVRSLVRSGERQSGGAPEMERADRIPGVASAEWEDPRRELAEHSGILGALGEFPSGESLSLDGRGDPERALSALRGALSEAPFEHSGFGLRGTGRPSTIAFGDLETIGSGGEDGVIYGQGIARLRGRRSAVPCESSGMGGCVRFCSRGGCAARSMGALSKEVVGRTIRLHRREIEFCYERALIGRPDLSGRVEVQFVISGTGQVVSSGISSSTVEDPQLGSCVSRAVERIVFPWPDGAISATIVTYPFIFIPAGA